MNSEKREKIKQYLNDQILNIDLKKNAYIFDENNKKRPERDLYSKIYTFVNDFLEGDKSKRWLILTGLRGAGKTTLMFQILSAVYKKDVHVLCLSVDQIFKLLNVSLYDVLSVYEDLMESSYEGMKKPLFLFLDEVQYDEKWAITLKSIYDRSPNVFIFSTGSSALSINSNTDVARRAIFEKVFPLSFVEFLKIKYKKKEEKKLGDNIREIIFNSKDAKTLFTNLEKMESVVDRYYLDVNVKIEIEKYLRFGSLPFMISLNNEALVYEQINKTLEKVVNIDIQKMYNFSLEVLNKISGILYALSSMDKVNYVKVAESFNISRSKVSDIFEALERAEILNRVFPYGSHLGQIKKPSKYLFTSPAFRSMHFNLMGNIVSDSNARGVLLEDLINMYLQRILLRSVNRFITYDFYENGADFIIGYGDKKIIIEVGAGHKSLRQIANTSKRIKTDYNLIICNDSLELNQELKTVKIPLKLFLLT